jgi:hypothetical protein
VLRSAGFTAFPINFSVPSEGSDHSGALTMINLRAEAYWTLREALDPGLGATLALPPSKELETQLSAPTWSLTPHGIKIEDKEKVEERLGKSPDEADSLALVMLDMSLRMPQHLPTSHSHRIMTGQGHVPSPQPAQPPQRHPTQPSQHGNPPLPPTPPYQQHVSSHAQRVRIVYDDRGNEHRIND